MPDWSAAILIGGQGRRMGGLVKAHLEVGGRSVLERQVAMLAGLGVTPRLVGAVPSVDASGLEIVPDHIDAGALGGVYTALATAPTPIVVVLAGDMPFLTAPFIELLLARLAQHDAAIPHDGQRWHPLAAAYRAAVAPRLRATIDAGERRVVRAVAALDVARVDQATLAALTSEGPLLCNLNTPADHARAHRDAVGPPASAV